MSQHNSSSERCVNLDRTRFARNGPVIDISAFRERNGAPKLEPDHNGRYNVMVSISTFTDRSSNGRGVYEDAIIRLRDTQN